VVCDISNLLMGLEECLVEDPSHTLTVVVVYTQSFTFNSKPLSKNLKIREDERSGRDAIYQQRPLSKIKDQRRSLPPQSSLSSNKL
jgi:hypothetical protein